MSCVCVCVCVCGYVKNSDDIYVCNIYIACLDTERERRWRRAIRRYVCVQTHIHTYVYTYCLDTEGAGEEVEEGFHGGNTNCIRVPGA